MIEFKAIKCSKAPDDGAPGQLVTKFPDCILGILAVNKFSVLIKHRLHFHLDQLLSVDMHGIFYTSMTSRPMLGHLSSYTVIQLPVDDKSSPLSPGVLVGWLMITICTLVSTNGIFT